MRKNTIATLIQTGTVKAQPISVKAPVRTAFGAAVRPANYSRTEFLTLPLPGTRVTSAGPSEQILPPALLPGIDYQVRRAVSPVSGKALEKLGHAIEYLTDELAFESAVSESAICCDPTLQAIMLLKSLNRRVYFECPIIEPLVQRLFKRLFPRQSVPRI